jgi:type I site-specific restriction endonuclease
VRVKVAELRDDIDGGSAQETIAFAFDGGRYQLDLSKKNATRFRAAMRPYVEAAVISQYRRVIDQHLDVEIPHVEAAAVRRWANAMKPGSVAARGRISKAVYFAYNAAHAETTIHTTEGAV